MMMKLEDIREVPAVGPSHQRGATKCTVKIIKFGTYIHTYFRVAIKKTRKPPKKTVGPTEDIQDMQPYKYSRTYKAPRSKYVRMQA